MTDTHIPKVNSLTEDAVLQALAYFEVFSYPLTQEEVFDYCGEASATRTEVGETLQRLVAQGRIFQFESFFQMKEDASWAAQRLHCNRMADDFLPKAREMARFIGQFPFVRGVFVSGSLSKHCMRPESDVDFFIVTVPGRLWLARTLLVVFKKIFLLNSHKYFCVNYFVDTANLEIEEKNLFTATESVTLLPMWGREFYEAFCQENAWAWQSYPHFTFRATAEVPPHTRRLFKTLLENLLAGSFGNWLDKKAMRFTVGYWKKKFRHLHHTAFDIALKSRRGVSKHHPLHFQEKVLTRMEENLKTLKNTRN
jgi:hypothetical protein